MKGNAVFRKNSLWRERVDRTKSRTGIKVYNISKKSEKSGKNEEIAGYKNQLDEVHCSALEERGSTA